MQIDWDKVDKRLIPREDPDELFFILGHIKYLFGLILFSKNSVLNTFREPKTN